MNVGIYRQGFTILEVLIVIVVIGILATITIISYNGVTERANNTTVENDLRKIGGQFESYKSEHGVYPAGTGQLTEIGISVTKSAYGAGLSNLHNLIYCRVTVDGSGNPVSGPFAFALIAQSKSGKVYAYKSSTGETEQLTGWTGTGSNTNCQAVGINQVSGSDRDIMHYNGSWQPYVAG